MNESNEFKKTSRELAAIGWLSIAMASILIIGCVAGYRITSLLAAGDLDLPKAEAPGLHEVFSGLIDVYDGVFQIVIIASVFFFCLGPVVLKCHRKLLRNTCTVESS